jgi:hypothetical protein
MRREKKAFAFGWDALESRTFLSVAHSGLHGGAAEVGVARVVKHVAQGSLHGTFTIAADSTGAPALSVNGSGNIKPLGFVTATGSLAGNSAMAGTVQGSVLLTNSRGTVTLILSSSPTSNLRRPIKIQVTVASGTGAFQGIHGSGSGTLVLSHLTANNTAGNFTFNVRAVTN